MKGREERYGRRERGRRGKGLAGNGEKKTCG
jgi:hypothetical protein